MYIWIKPLSRNFIVPQPIFCCKWRQGKELHPNRTVLETGILLLEDPAVAAKLGIEPRTLPLTGERSTAELLRRGVSPGTRTQITAVTGLGSTVELRTQTVGLRLPP